MTTYIKKDDVNVATKSEFIAMRVHSQLQSNQAYLNGRMKGIVQVDGEKIRWYRCTRVNKNG